MNPYMEAMFNELEQLDEWYEQGFVSLSEYFDIKHRIVENCQRKLKMQKICEKESTKDETQCK